MTVNGLDRWLESEIIELGEVPETLREVLEGQQAVLLPQHGWAFLPDPGESGNWRLFSQDAEAEKQARDIIQAFLGPVLGLIQNQSKQLEVGESKVPLRATDFVKSENVEPEKIIQSIHELLTVLTGRPVIKNEVSHSISHLLREFEFALFRRDKKLADETLRQLQDDGTLTEFDRAHIEITYDATFEDWHKIVNRHQLANLCKQPTPRRVRDHIFTAFWELEFASDENLIAEDVISRFSESEISSLSNLFSGPKPPGCYAGKCFLAIYLRGTPNKRLLDQLLESASEISDEKSALIYELAEQGNADSITVEVDETPLMEIAQNLEEKNDVSGLTQLAEENLQDISLVALAIRSILANNDSQLASALYEALKPSETLGIFLAEHSNLVEFLKELAGTECNEWLMWFKKINSETVWESANEIVKNDSPNWEVETLSSQGQLSEITKHFESSLDGVNKQEVRNSLPAICQLAEDITGLSGSEKFVSIVLFALLDIDNPSQGERTAFLSLVDTLLSDLENPVSVNMYQDILELIDDLWEKSKSPVLLEWAFSIVETLAFFPSPDKDRRINTLVNIFQAVHQYKEHIEIEDLKMIRRVNKECQLGITLPKIEIEENELNVWQKLVGKTICVYTLLEGQVLIRFEEQLKDLVGSDNFTVECRNFKKGGEKVRDFAKKADYLVVDTWHASHAATGSIDDAVGKAKQIIPKTGGRGCQRWIKRLKETLEK